MSSACQRQGDRCFFMASQRQWGDRYRFSMRDSTGSGLGHVGHRLDGPARPAPLVLTSNKNSYKVMSFLGQGAFGKVLSCKDTVTNRTVAVKMVKDSTPGSKRELEILRKLQQQRFDPDEHNFVRCFQFFHFSGYYCLVLEQLHMSLKEFISRNQPLSLGEIRPIVQQVATALQMLKRAGIIHTDLKPDNIMLVDHRHQPLRVKVIDFGCACTTSEVKCGANIQSPWYRSPEILLGHSYTGAIDMWSLGCVAAELFLGAVLFPGTSEYDIMRFITETQGLPPAHLLHASTKTNMYFTRDLTGVRRLKTPVEASVRSGGTRVYTLCSLDGIKEIHPLSTELKSQYLRTKDRHRFVDLLKKMLEIDPGKRLEPEHVLQHQFVTMSHLVDSLQHSSFVRSCYDKMGVCQTQRGTAPTERKRPSYEAAESSPDQKTQRVTAPTERKRPSSEAAERRPDQKTHRVTAPTERKRPSSEAAERRPDQKTQRGTVPTERKRPSSEAAERRPDQKTQRVTAPTERKRPSSEAAERRPDQKTHRVTAPTERKRPSSEAAESSPDRKRKK